METIEAFADETVFRNDENGYTVLVVKAGKSRVSAVGVMPPVTSGEKLRITGEWTEHPVYGRQIKVQSLEIEQPTTLSGIEKYLSSGMIRGVGPATAKLLIRAFGEKTLDVLYSEPERLLEVSGIGEKRARMIQESYAEQAQQREAMVFLQGYGVTPALAVKIYKRYGENVRQVITRNPYRLVEDVEGIGFKTADRIAASLGIEQDSEYRLSAGVKYTLSDATAVAGHCYLPRPELALAARRILGNDPDLIERTIDSLILSHEIAAQILPGDDDEDVVALYLPSTYRAESEVARRLREMIDAMPDTMATDLSAQIDELERVEGIAFHAQQRQAIETAVTSGMTVITGGPGTGKTTIIKCIIKLLSVHGDIALAAPTGRAAKRMSEACGMEAKTLHRLLEYGGEEGDFARTQDNPLEYDALIIDEMSMVDIFLMRSLLRALVPGTRLIMVGDADQLPSVGAGNVLRDLIAAGELGEIYHVYCSFRAHRSIPGLGGAFTTKAMAGGGALIDWGVHFIDLIFFCIAEPAVRTVSAATYCKLADPMENYTYTDMWAGPPDYSGTCDVEEFVTGLVRTEGPTISMNGAWAQNIGERQMYIEFLGTKAGIKLDYGGNFVLYSTKNGMLTETKFDYPTQNMYEVEIRDFLLKAPQGIKTKGNIDHAILSSRLMDMIYKSAELGEEVKA